MIAVDSTSDGKPDPKSALTLGGSSGSDNSPAAPPAPTDSATASPAPAATAPAAGSGDGGQAMRITDSACRPLSAFLASSR